MIPREKKRTSFNDDDDDDHHHHHHDDASGFFSLLKCSIVLSTRRSNGNGSHRSKSGGPNGYRGAELLGDEQTGYVDMFKVCWDFFGDVW